MLVLPCEMIKSVTPTTPVSDSAAKSVRTGENLNPINISSTPSNDAIRTKAPFLCAQRVHCECQLRRQQFVKCCSKFSIGSALMISINFTPLTVQDNRGIQRINLVQIGEAPGTVHRPGELIIPNGLQKRWQVARLDLGSKVYRDEPNAAFGIFRLKLGQRLRARDTGTAPVPHRIKDSDLAWIPWQSDGLPIKGRQGNRGRYSCAISRGVIGDI